MKLSTELESNELYQNLKHLRDNGKVYQYYSDQEYNGKLVTVNGRKMLHFANCSYLGLEQHPNLIASSIDAVKRYGTQNSMSRAMLSSPLYKQLEEYLSQMFPGYQIVYPTTTLSHCSVLPLIIGEKDALILDSYLHNSVRMASHLCVAKGTFSVVSKHNDIEHIKYLVYRLKKEGYNRIWYCADGLYSIHGNLCNIEGIVELLDQEEQFYAYIDDAHSTGWLGKNGSGHAIQNNNYIHEKLVVVHSFAKSIAGSGGCVVVSDQSFADFLKLAGQTMIFSGPLQPAVVGSLVASIQLHLSNEINIMQEELHNLIDFFRYKCIELNLPIVTKSNTPIQLLKIGNMKDTFEILDRLMENGYFIMTATYPAIAKGEEGIRVTITRHLSKDDIDGLLNCIYDFMLEKGIAISHQHILNNS